MDDDLTFAASVWGSSNPVESLSTLRPSTNSFNQNSLDDGAFDDFDDFGPSETALEDHGDDDFGDFGDFNNTETLEFSDVLPVAGPSSRRDWFPLKLDPLPTREDLEAEICGILGSIWENEDISDVTTDESIREAEGVNQILLTTESRELHKMLLQTPPPTKPPNWTRSRIRRQHLIALGIPINLDEVLPRANEKPLPTLEIRTRPSSVPPGSRSSTHANNAGSATNYNSRAGSPVVGKPNISGQFGPKPELDMTRIHKLLEIDPESLTIQSLSTLERYLADFKAQTANTSSLLAHLLQTRDALQQDSETYNGLIAELVGEAQKIKTKPRTTNKRGSNFV